MRNPILYALRQHYLRPGLSPYQGQFSNKSKQHNHIPNKFLRLLFNESDANVSYESVIRDLVRRDYLVKIDSETVIKIHGKPHSMYLFGNSCRVWDSIENPIEKRESEW